MERPLTTGHSYVEPETDARQSYVRELSSASARAAVRFVSASADRLWPGAPAEPTSRPHAGLWVVTRGSLRLQGRQSEVSVPARRLALAPADCPVTEVAEGSGPADRMFVGFSPGDELTDGLVVLEDAAGRVRELARWLVAERASRAVDAAAYRVRVLQLLEVELKRLRTDARTNLEREVRAYALEHLSDRISLDDLARAVGMSRSHFCRTYHAVVGEPPMSTLRRLRLERARHLLLDTGLTLREIAGEIGMSGEFHLSRLLRAHFGVGARELRRVARERRWAGAKDSGEADDVETDGSESSSRG